MKTLVIIFLILAAIIIVGLFWICCIAGAKADETMEKIFNKTENHEIN